MTAGRKKRTANAQIAGEDEVLECLTSVLRGTEGEDERITPRARREQSSGCGRFAPRVLGLYGMCHGGQIAVDEIFDTDFGDML